MIPSAAFAFGSDAIVNYLNGTSNIRTMIGAEVVKVSFNQGKFEFDQLH